MIVNVMCCCCFCFHCFLFYLFAFAPCSVTSFALPSKCIRLQMLCARLANITVQLKNAAEENTNTHTHSSTFKTRKFDPQICVYIEMEFLNLVRVKFLHSYAIWCCCFHSRWDMFARASFIPFSALLSSYAFSWRTSRKCILPRWHIFLDTRCFSVRQCATSWV